MIEEPRGHVSPIIKFKDSSGLSESDILHVPELGSDLLIWPPFKQPHGDEMRREHFLKNFTSLNILPSLNGCLTRCGRLLSNGRNLIAALDIIGSQADLETRDALNKVAEKAPGALLRTPIGRVIYIWSLVNTPIFSHKKIASRVDRLANIDDEHRKNLIKALEATYLYLSQSHARPLVTTLRYSHLLTLCSSGCFGEETSKPNYSIKYATPADGRGFGYNSKDISELLAKSNTYRISEPKHELYGENVKKVYRYHMDSPLSFVLHYKQSPCAFLSLVLADPQTLCIVQMQGIRAQIFGASGFLQHGRVVGVAGLDWETELLNYAVRVAKGMGCHKLAIIASANVPYDKKDLKTRRVSPIDRIYMRLDGLAKRTGMSLDSSRGLYFIDTDKVGG